jgi:sulfonate transport system ATP-binding protein
MAPGRKARPVNAFPRGAVADSVSALSAGAPAPPTRVLGLVRRFGPTAVLDGLNLEIPAGSFIALLGRSGSGKTTLLRTLAGLDTAEQGEVTLPPRRAVVFQEPRLMPWKRIWENVALGLPAHHARQRAEQALREVELAHRMDAWPLTLSGGEAQRAGLASALVRDPDLLLLDEPFAALDALTRLRMQALVTALWRRHGMAALLVTHDVEEALLLADHAVVLQRGRIGLQLRIDLPRPWRHAAPAFARLRGELLAALGVSDEEAE